MGYPHFSGDCSDYHDKVIDWGRLGRRGEVPAPTIVTLCGSTRFKDEINRVNAELTMQGNLVISLGVFGHIDMPDHDWTTNGNDDKRMLDELHKRKIDLADLVYIVNPGGYIGESTRGEIEYAERRGKRIAYLVSPYPSLSAADALLRGAS